ALTRALEGRFFALKLRDETRPRRDIWEGREQDSLRGLFLARLWAQYQAAPEGPERARISLAARFGLQALENGEEPPLP
ncbi:MAG: DNA repair exonuclease, partial [Oscillospiraceae bacterium]|nr:DNA repair exonuclease [Oscillospiraceae bacterium]